MNKMDLYKPYKRRQLQIRVLRGVGNVFLFKERKERVTVVKILNNNQVYFYYTDSDSRYEGRDKILCRHQYYIHIVQFINRIEDKLKRNIK